MMFSIYFIKDSPLKLKNSSRIVLRGILRVSEMPEVYFIVF